TPLAARPPRQTRPARRALSPELVDRGVRLSPVGGLFRHARGVARGELGYGVAHSRARARTDHQDHAWPLARADEGVLDPRRRVEEVPGAQASLLVLDE